LTQKVNAYGQAQQVQPLFYGDKKYEANKWVKSDLVQDNSYLKVLEDYGFKQILNAVKECKIEG
jgi:hypothetical protein